MYVRDYTFEPSASKRNQKGRPSTGAASNSEDEFLSFDDENMTQVIMDIDSENQ